MKMVNDIRILVLALGNDLLGDDAAGFLVAEAIERLLPNELRNRVDVTKSSRAGFYLLDYLLEGHDRVLIVDSVIGEPPGEIARIDLRSLRPAPAPSPHYSGLPEVLEILSSVTGRKPEVEIYAIKIREPEIGSEVSDEVRAAAGRLALILLQRIREILGVLPDGSDSKPD